MRYKEWVQENGHLDRVIRPLLPPDEELEKLTRQQVVDRFGGEILRATEALGIELTAEDLHAVLDRVHGLPELPKFHKKHYDLHL